MALVALIGLLGWLQARLQAAHAKQVESLLQRIQAPEAAVFAHQTAVLPPVNPPSLPFDDDEAFHKTREDMVEELAREMNLD